MIPLVYKMRKGPMRRKVRLCLTFLTGLAILSTGCKKNESIWRGTIEVKNGITIVSNPKEPMFSEEIMNLEEDLSIGVKEGLKEYMFSQIRDIDVDEDGNIYAVDQKEAQIKVFDGDGEYLRTIGRRGQGPGELAAPYFLSITAQKHLVVEDVANRRMAFFTLKGEFIKDVSTAANFFFGSIIDSTESYYGILSAQDDDPHYELRKFSPELEYLHTLASSPSVLTSQKIYKAYSPMITYDLTKYDQVVFGFPDRYEISICDPKGVLVRKITRVYDPVEISAEERAEYEKRQAPPGYTFEIPKFHSAYNWIFVDDQGRIFIATWEKSENMHSYDIFTAEGKYLAKVLLGITPMVMKKNKIYTIEADEEGYQKIKRYQITWLIEWDRSGV
jgi:hypothetical protein